MAKVSLSPSSRKRMVYLGPLTLCVAGAYWWSILHRQHQKESVENFAIVYAGPTGWKKLPHGPQTLFLYKDPKTNILMRGSVSQIISDTNPTPELDTDGIAQFYMDRTHENQKNWTAVRLGKASNPNEDFSVIRRATKDRVVVTAFAVKGNTTLLVSVSGSDKATTSVDKSMPEFYSYLRTIGLRKEDMSRL